MGYRPIKDGTIVRIEVAWCASFALLPHRTISGRWVWLKPIYVRRVWRYSGVADEPYTEYGTAFDILRDV
jgi:hypothetical protein